MSSWAAFRDITRWKSWNWTNCRYFRIKQSRKEESNSDSFCNTRTGILDVLVFKLPKFWNNTTDAMLSSNTKNKTTIYCGHECWKMDENSITPWSIRKGWDNLTSVMSNDLARLSWSMTPLDLFFAQKSLMKLDRINIFFRVSGKTCDKKNLKWLHFIWYTFIKEIAVCFTTNWKLGNG